MHQAPGLVWDAQELPPERREGDEDERQGRGPGRLRPPGGGYGVQEPPGLRLRDEQDHWVSEDEEQGDHGDLAVEVVDDVDPVGGRHVPKARGHREEQAHHREPGEAQGHGELDPEAPARGRGPDQEEQHWRERQEEVHAYPERPLQQVAIGFPLGQLHHPSSAHPDKGTSGEGYTAWRVRANKVRRHPTPAAGTYQRPVPSLGPRRPLDAVPSHGPGFSSHGGRGWSSRKTAPITSSSTRPS